MHAANLIASAVRGTDLCPELPCQPVPDQICVVTGEVGPCLPKKEVVLSTSTDYSWFLAPMSEWAGVDVFQAWNCGLIKDGAKRRSCFERGACWWTDGKEFCVIKRAEIRKIVLDGSPSVPWAMWVTTSYKKHGSIRSPVNHSDRGIIGFDELRVDVSDSSRVLDWWQHLNMALAANIGRTVIESLNCPSHLIRTIGAAEWIRFEKWARPKYMSPVYKLLCYLLPSKEERENANAADGDIIPY
jgi:hypothetical protein